MPVTARLSQKFYDRLGDDITVELVEWMNHVDTASHSSLRDLNDLNFARFDAKLAALRTEMYGGFATLETRMIRWMVGLWIAQTALFVTILLQLR